MTLLDQDPEPSAASDGPEMSYSQLSPSHAVVPPPINDIDPASRHHLQPKQNAAARLKSSSSHPSLLLLSTSTTDPSLFSFDLIKRLNKQHLASIPPNPFSAISVAQQQQQKQKRQRLESEPNTAVPPTASSSVLPSHHSPVTHNDSSPRIPVSQLRRASAPDSTSPTRHEPSASSLTLPEIPQRPASSEASKHTSRASLPHRRSLDEVSLRRIAEDKSGPPDPSPSHRDAKMTAAIGYNPTDLFSSFNTARFVGAIGNEDPMSSSASLQSGRRPTVINQTRELYLHPSQIFAQDSAGTAYNDISGYFSSTLNVNGVNGSTSNGTSGIESAIALPPMLTLEEIMQPHVFAKQGGTADGNLARNFGMPFAPQSPGSLSNIESALPLDTSATSFFAGYPDVPPVAQQTWNASSAQLGMQGGETYSSYMPPEPTSGYPGACSTSQLMTSPSLQHAQGIMAFSERVIMPPMPAPAMPSHSPTALSPGSKRRDVSPARPSTRDGIMSQRSTTPVDSVPQKRSGKLPASVTTTLKNWLLAHTQHPYPTEEEKRALCSDTGLTMNQVSNWFINARRRILPNLGNVAMAGNRKQLTQYNPPGPRRVYSHGAPQGYPAYHTAESEALYANGVNSLATARMRSHPYSNYGPSNGAHGPLATYNYNPDIGPY